MFEGPQSGKFGILHNNGAPITHMFNWALDSINHTPETYIASNTRWAPNRNPGVIDWTGNFSLFDGSYIAFPGQFMYSGEFFTAPESGVYGNPGATYCGQAIIESVVLTWAWGAEQSLTQMVNFAANGCLACRNRVIDDTTIETPSKMCGLRLNWSFASPPAIWESIDNIQQAVLTINGTNPAFVNSSTGCCTHRRPGNIDWTLALTMTDHRCITISRERVPSFRLYNNPTDYWELVYSIFNGTTNVMANRQTGEIQSQVANFSMKGMSGSNLGWIYTPGDPTGTNKPWPPTPTTSSVPDPPTGVTAARDGTTQDIDISWTAPASGDAPTGYTIWASPDGIDFACVGSSVGTSYKDVGIIYLDPTLYPGALNQWYYRVASTNAQGQGEFSSVDGPVDMS